MNDAPTPRENNAELISSTFLMERMYVERKKEFTDSDISL
jgi:hypothetical protein